MWIASASGGGTAARADAARLRPVEGLSDRAASTGSRRISASAATRTRRTAAVDSRLALRGSPRAKSTVQAAL